jgi:hypothetical protein
MDWQIIAHGEDRIVLAAAGARDETGTVAPTEPVRVARLSTAVLYAPVKFGSLMAHSPYLCASPPDDLDAAEVLSQVEPAPDAPPKDEIGVPFGTDS